MSCKSKYFKLNSKILEIQALTQTFLCVCVCLYAFSRAAPWAYGGSQARD